MKQWKYRATIIKTAILCSFLIFVLYHSIYIEKLSESEKQTPDAFGSPSDIVIFWQQLQKQKSTDASTLLALFETDMQTAINTYGTALGVSSNHSFLVHGKAQVMKINDDAILVTIDSKNALNSILIQTDFIFGNAIRDASGLVSVNDFPSMLAFNDISSRINAYVTSHILPPFLDKVAVGDSISFVGAALIHAEAPELDPLAIVPITLKILDTE